MGKKNLLILALAVILCFPILTFAETIILKSGKSVQGKIITKTDKYIKIDFQGVPLTYFFDEIESIDGKEPSVSVTKEAASKNNTAGQLEPKSSSLNSQKDGLFKINVPKGWQWHDEKPGCVYITPPPPNGGGIVINFEKTPKPETPEEIKARLSSLIEANTEAKSGTVIENRETTIDNVYARRLRFTVLLKEGFFYFTQLVFVNKGYTYNTMYFGRTSEEEAKMKDVFDTLRF